MTDNSGFENINKRYQKLKSDAEQGEYHLNPDLLFTEGLISGLLVNLERYGYEVCPCRLATGDAAEDRDMICPCDYRDSDLIEYGACYCGLYLSSALINQKAPAPVIPDRRPAPKDRMRSGSTSPLNRELPYPIWRCKVCGYLCAREQPPEVCPICKAKHDRFEVYIQ